MVKPKIFHIGLCVYPDRKDGISQAMIKASSDYRELSSGDKQLNRKAIEIAEEFKPDIVFMQIQTEGIIHKETVVRMVAGGAVVMNWTGDVREDVPPWMYSIGHDVSITLFTNMRDVTKMAKDGYRAGYLEIGYDPEIFTPEGKVNEIKPVVFFGNNTHSFPMSSFRHQMCNFLTNKFGGNFGVYGNSPVASGNYNGSQIEEAAAYRSTKLAINVSHFEIQNYTSDRMLRILGMGVPLCLAKHFPGIEDMYQDGVHLRVWYDLEQLEALIRHYMNPANEDERLRMVKAGHDLALKRLTYDSMIKNIISIYHAITKA